MVVWEWKWMKVLWPVTEAISSILQFLWLVFLVCVCIATLADSVNICLCYSWADQLSTRHIFTTLLSWLSLYTFPWHVLVLMIKNVYMFAVTNTLLSWSWVRAVHCMYTYNTYLSVIQKICSRVWEDCMPSP